MLSRAQNNDGDDKKQAPALQKLRGQQGPPQVICSRVFRAPRALGATLGNAEVASQTPEGVLRKPGSIIEAWSASSDEAEPARKVKIETETAWEPQALKVDLMRVRSLSNPRFSMHCLHGCRCIYQRSCITYRCQQKMFLCLYSFMQMCLYSFMQMCVILSTVLPLRGCSCSNARTL